MEENISLWVPTFCKFCYETDLDGFLFEVPASLFAKSIQHLADLVNRTLKFLTFLDTNKSHWLPSDKIDSLPSNEAWANIVEKKRWVFSFSGQTFFISSFSPIYPSSHPRYTYGSNSVFILFQPELSFATHNLPPERRHSNHLATTDGRYATTLDNGDLHGNEFQRIDDHRGNASMNDDYDDSNTTVELRTTKEVEGVRNVRDEIRTKFGQCGQEYVVYDRMVYSAVLPLYPTPQRPINFARNQDLCN